MFNSIILLTLTLSLFHLPLTGNSITKNLDKYFSQLYKYREFNGNVLIAEKGKVIYEKSFGYADFASKRLNKKKSTFPIASITKTFTATAILQLNEQGKLSVNDKVIKYFPEFPYPAITIKNLLSHTSGLRPYDNFFDSLRQAAPDTVFTNKDILPRFASLKLNLKFKPGDNSDYENTNYIFLALIVEKVSGIQFHEYIQKNILQPAGMIKTFFPRFTFYHYNAKEKRDLSLTYLYPHLYSEEIERADTIGFVSKYWHTYNFEGFGEIVSTTEDLLKYDRALYNGKLLNEVSQKIAYTPVEFNNGEINPLGFGLGWEVKLDSEQGKIVMHSGGMIGLRSILLRDITRNQTIILIDNTQNEVYEIAMDALKILNKKSVRFPRKDAVKLYAQIMVTKGIDPAKKALKQFRSDSLNYEINENELNTLGYDLLNTNIQEALEVFKTNMELFPLSWNVYDSYGEALLKNGEKDKAIKMYRKSIEINPTNENGKNVLTHLLNNGD